MKPHRRKKTSPRREQEPAGQGDAPAPEGEVPTEPADEAPQYEEPAVSYDPGQALAEENQTYENPNQQQYVDPNQQQYVDPNQQQYVDPNQQQNVDPNQQQYVDPNQQQYVDPNQQQYVDPNQQQYVDPNQQEEVVPPPPEISAPAAGVYDSSPEPAPTPQVPRTVPSKKVVGHRVQGRKPVTSTGRGRPAYKRPARTYTPSGGGISMMTVFMTLVALGMLAIVAMIMLPKDLSSVKGYPVNPMADAKPRNLLSEAQKLMIDRSGKVSFSEAEVNQYLNQRIEGTQGGALAALVQFKGIYADFSNENVEFTIEREIFGFPITMSSLVKAENFRGSLSFRSQGWTLGKINLSSRNVKPVIDMFIRMRASFLDEYQVLQTMANVSFEQDKITLSTSR